MNRLIFSAAFVVAGAMAWPAIAQAASKDVEIAPAKAGRATLAVDPRESNRQAIAIRTPECNDFYAVHLTDDGGATWRLKCALWGSQDDEVPTEVPAVAFNRKGVLVLVQPLWWDSDGGSLRATRSVGSGHAWDGWSTLAHSAYYKGSILNPRVEVDASPSSPHRHTLYASFTDVGWWDGHQSRIRVSRSDDGIAWSTVDATPEAVDKEQVDFSDLAIDRSGHVYVSYLSCTGGIRNCRGRPAELRLVRSTDGGVSWSKPVVLGHTQLPDGKEAIGRDLSFSYGALPETKAAVSYTPAIAVDASEGPWQNRLYAVMTTYADKRLQVLLTHSDDQGATWTAPRPVSIGPRAADQFVPSVSVSRQGVVSVTWMDQRKHPQQPGYQPMVAFSTDGGATFSAPTVLQREAADPTVLKDLRGSVTHAWAGKRLKTAFIGPDAAGEASLRLSTSKP